MNIEYDSSPEKGKRFDIRDYVEFGQNGRGLCPCCSPNHSNNETTLSLVPNTDGAYKCFRGCTTEEIREALGQPKTKIVPTAIAKGKPKKDYSVDEQQVLAYFSNLMSMEQASLDAIRWLANRGITTDLIKRYKLGLCKARLKGKSRRYVWAISIPIPSYFGDKFFIKKRVAPWDKELPQEEGYRKWSQYGISPSVLFTCKPEKPTETWLCEGEWDAILLGWMVEQHREDVAVASFTNGCDSIPSKDWLDKLPGEVKIFYDRNDNLKPDGTRAGEKAARKVAQALGERAKIAKVPMPENSTVKGWDVTDAIQHGYSLESFERASLEAESVEAINANSFRQKTRSLSQLYREAPDYVDWLVPDLLTCNELYCLAAPPRAGKSLLGLGLLKAIASGGMFLGRRCQQGKGLYVCREDPDDKVKERLIAQEWEERQMDGVFINNDFTLEELPELIQYIREEKPAILILDTLSRIQTRNTRENSAEITDVLAPFQTLARQENICILVIHHTKKNIPRGLDLQEKFDAVRGSGAIRGTCRGMFVLVPEKDGYHLAAETGRTEPEEMRIYLDPTTLTWHLNGKYEPPDAEQSDKDKLLELLVKHNHATIEQLYQWTQIQKRTIHKTLMRLVHEQILHKEGRQRNAVYYINQSRQGRQAKTVSNCSNQDGENDTGESRQEQKKTDQGGKVECFGKEVLSDDPQFHFDPKKESLSTSVEFSAKNKNEHGLGSGRHEVDKPDLSTSDEGGVENISIPLFKDYAENDVLLEAKVEFFPEKITEMQAGEPIYHKRWGWMVFEGIEGKLILVRSEGMQKLHKVDVRDCDLKREKQDGSTT